MTGKIRVLSEQTINEIAAGEVIENPASVVKELVENAVDAGSTQITIEIRGGGRQLIRITDNGCGMNPDDALLCLERHATSKIRSSSDIFSINTMGFRGEAVPSIASISKFTLITSPRVAAGEEARGTLVMVDGGRIASTGPAVREPGTTIEVKQLFFNVPVRKKFQRSPIYDTQEIEKICVAFALCYPLIQFHFISNEETILRTKANGSQNTLEALGERIRQLLGDSTWKEMRPCQAQVEGYKVEGYVSMPSLHKPNRSSQFLFLNQRYITAPMVSFCVKECYGTLLPANRYPLFVLAIQVPDGKVDVNVHPQKREVRFSYDLGIKAAIREALNPVLHGIKPTEADLNPLTPKIHSQSPHDEPSRISWAEQEWHNAIIGSREEESVKLPLPSHNTVAHDPVFVNHAHTRNQAPLPWEASATLPKPKPFFLSPEESSENEKIYSPKENEPSLLFKSPTVSQYSPPLPKLIATIPRYLLLDGKSLAYTSLQSKTSEECLFALVDQRRAHHRILFEELSSSQSIQEVQHLLIPYSFDLSPSENSLWTLHQEKLQLFGISIRQVGPHTWNIEALPAALGNIQIGVFIEDLMQSFKHSQWDDTQWKSLLAEKMALSANKAAISYSQSLTTEEANSLLKRLCQCKQPTICPLGKQTVVGISLTELQKRFN